MVQTSAHSRWVPAALSLFLPLALSGRLAVAAPPGSDDGLGRAVVQLPPASAAGQGAKVLSAAARTAVNYVDAAVQALQAGQPGEAGRLLAQVWRLLDQIQVGIRERAAAAPVAVIPVLARVRLGDGGEAGQGVADRVRALEPQVLAGEHEQVLAALLDLGVSLTYEYVGMPVQATSDGLDRARAALAAGDPGGAQGALWDIVHGLEVRTLSIGLTPPPGQGPGPGETPR
jgi:hypothetical protein